MTEEKMRLALEELYQACLSGNFYADYDEASRLLGVARDALSTKQEAEGEVSRSQTAAPFDPATQEPAASVAEEMAQQLAELIECAERDLKMNRDEEPGGHWSLRTANCFLPARDALARYHALSQEGLVASASETEENAEIMAAEAALLAELVEGFLACPEIADCAPEDKDPDTHELERRARAILRGDAQGLVAGADGKGDGK